MWQRLKKILVQNQHLRVRDEGIVTKCGENTGEKFIPGFGEN